MNYLSILAVTVALFGSANVFAKQSWRTFDGSSCVDPAGNCYPIDIDIKGTKAFSANLAAFEAAVNSGTTKSYFSSEKWRYV